MRKLILSLAIIFAAVISDAAPLIRAIRKPGESEPNPHERSLTVDANGKMTLIALNPQTKKVGPIDLGTLSRFTMGKLMMTVNEINPNSYLVDRKPFDPSCGNIASKYYVSVWIRGKEKQIHKSEACHDWFLDGGEGKNMADFALFFLD